MEAEEEKKSNKVPSLHRSWSEMEGKHYDQTEDSATFKISAVIDPETKNEISMQQAVAMNVLNVTEGVYNDKFNHKISIAEAMSKGLIKVQSGRSEKKKVSYGLITIKTMREKPPTRVITEVKDARFNTWLSVAQASFKGIINEKNDWYNDTAKKVKISIEEAITAGLVKADFESHGSNEEAKESYAIRAVIDKKRSLLVTFDEAVHDNIIDFNKGEFRNTDNDEWLPVTDAIKLGWIKGRKIEDEHIDRLGIDPKSYLVIDNASKITKNVVKPLQVIDAFKMMKHKK